MKPLTRPGVQTHRLQSMAGELVAQVLERLHPEALGGLHEHGLVFNIHDRLGRHWTMSRAISVNLHVRLPAADKAREDEEIHQRLQANFSMRWAANSQPSLPIATTFRP